MLRRAATSPLFPALLLSLYRVECGNIQMRSLLTECNSGISSFLCTSPISPPTYYLFFSCTIRHTRTEIWVWDVRDGRTGSLTDTTIAGNTVESRRWGRYVDIWVDVMKSRTFSLLSSVTPSKHCLPVFWQGSHQKPHASLNVCTQHPPTFQPPHSCWIFELFSEARLSRKQLTKCQVLLLDAPFKKMTAEDDYWCYTFFLSQTSYFNGYNLQIRHANVPYIIQMKGCSLEYSKTPGNNHLFMGLTTGKKYRYWYSAWTVSLRNNGLPWLI